MMRMFLAGILAFLIVAFLFVLVEGRMFLVFGQRRTVARVGDLGAAAGVDLRPRGEWDRLPRYLDLKLGDVLRITREDGREVVLSIPAVEAESRRTSCPRTRVTLEVDGKMTPALCGMREPEREGIGPVEAGGLKIGVEVTRLLFSDLSGGTSPFNTYRNFRLRGDVRLAIWDASRPAFRGEKGRFVVGQPRWTGDKPGNWLQRTSYGLHSAIDIFATRGADPEPVLSPVSGTIYNVYNVDASPGDSRRSKSVIVRGDSAVGPAGERVLYRFHHLSEILVGAGDIVRAGQPLGRTGHTGFDPSIGDHLHFEMRLPPSCFGLPPDGSLFATVPVNPYNFLLEWYGPGPGARQEERPGAGASGGRP